MSVQQTTFKAVAFDKDYPLIINGAPVRSATTLDVINPATRGAFAQAPAATREQLDDCIAAAAKAFPAWAGTPLAERQAKVGKLGAMLQHFHAEFEALLTRETGKPIASDAPVEVGTSAMWFQIMAQMGLEDEVLETPERTSTTEYTPLGVCVGIVPWNFPMLMLSWKVSAALVAGNCIIVKPSPYTPLTTIKFVELAQQLLPPGVLSVLSGTDELGAWMTCHPGIAGISFTGSTDVGKKVMENALKSVKRVTLELGGNDAMIICPDVDVKALAPLFYAAMFLNAGQLCSATKRTYIHEDVYDDLRDALVAIAKSVKVGDGSKPETQLGPMQNQRQYDKVLGFIDDCKANGYKFACGGEVDLQSPGYFVPVTIIDNPPEHSRIVQEEPFGPIAPLIKWKDEADVIHRANNTEFGLCAAVFSQDMSRARRIAKQMDAGTVWINEIFVADPRAPFGGHKTSGLGADNGKDGLRRWTNTRVTTVLKPKTD